MAITIEQNSLALVATIGVGCIGYILTGHVVLTGLITVIAGLAFALIILFEELNATRQKQFKSESVARSCASDWQAVNYQLRIATQNAKDFKRRSEHFYFLLVKHGLLEEIDTETEQDTGPSVTSELKETAHWIPPYKRDVLLPPMWHNDHREGVSDSALNAASLSAAALSSSPASTLTNSSAVPEHWLGKEWRSTPPSSD